MVLPSTCTAGDTFFKTDATPGQNIYGCSGANTWSVQSGGIPAVAGNADRLLGTNGLSAGWFALGGDISGSPQTLQVTGLRGNRVSSSTPTDGQVLRWNSTALNWEPGTVASTSSSGSGTTGGDLYGPVSGATVTRLQNRPISATAPTDGQVLTWSQGVGQWQPQSAGTGSSSGSGSTSATLNVLGVTYSSGNTLTIGGGCSPSAPCNVRFGNNVLSITTSSTVTWQSGTGTAFLYITAAGAVVVGSNLTLTCAGGCITASGTSSFPVNTVPLFTWNALLTGWDPTGGRDARAYLSTKLVSAGTGVLLVESAQQSTIAVDTTLIPTYTTGLSTISFGTLAANSCSIDTTVSVPGAAIGDAVAPGWPATLPTSLLGMMRVSAANQVAVRLCNLSGASVNVASSSYRATVVRGL